MRSFSILRRGVTATICLCALAAARVQPSTDWTKDFSVEPGELVSTGRNPFFILEPGYRLVLSHGTTQLTITVLSDTKVVDGVQTRVVEERETDRGSLVEVSRNYFAISRRTNSVFYFGEDVDMYKNGKITNHEGTWLSGVNGAHFGLMMPGTPLLRGRYYQELAPKIAMDRAEIVSLSEELKTPAKAFANLLETEETTPLEPRQKEYKWFAAGVGLVRDGDLQLAEYGRIAGTPPR